jgi:hypothetical protein
VSDGTLPAYSQKEKALQLHCGLGAGNMDDRENECRSQLLSSAEPMFPLLQAYITIRLALEKEKMHRTTRSGGYI